MQFSLNSYVCFSISLIKKMSNKSVKWWKKIKRHAYLLHKHGVMNIEEAFKKSKILYNLFDGHVGH